MAMQRGRQVLYIPPSGHTWPRSIEDVGRLDVCQPAGDASGAAPGLSKMATSPPRFTTFPRVLAQIDLSLAELASPLASSPDSITAMTNKPFSQALSTTHYGA